MVIKVIPIQYTYPKILWCKISGGVNSVFFIITNKINQQIVKFFFQFVHT